jgi:hypothetical protein
MVECRRDARPSEASLRERRGGLSWDIVRTRRKGETGSHIHVAPPISARLLALMIFARRWNNDRFRYASDARDDKRWGRLVEDAIGCAVTWASESIITPSWFMVRKKAILLRATAIARLARPPRPFPSFLSAG